EYALPDLSARGHALHEPAALWLPNEPQPCQKAGSAPPRPKLCANEARPHKAPPPLAAKGTGALPEAGIGSPAVQLGAERTRAPPKARIGACPAELTRGGSSCPAPPLRRSWSERASVG